MYAVGWADKKSKFLIVNVGTSHDAEPSVRMRHKRAVVNGAVTTATWEKLVPRPEVVKQYFQHFSTIDVHNHLRQGSLEIEQEWNTHTWWHRIFATVLGICVVDAFLAKKFETHFRVSEAQDFTTFIDRLAHQLIFNTFLTNSMSLRERGIDSTQKILVML